MSGTQSGLVEQLAMECETSLRSILEICIFYLNGEIAQAQGLERLFPEQEFCDLAVDHDTLTLNPFQRDGQFISR